MKGKFLKASGQSFQVYVVGLQTDEVKSTSRDLKRRQVQLSVSRPKDVPMVPTRRPSSCLSGEDEIELDAMGSSVQRADRIELDCLVVRSSFLFRLCSLHSLLKAQVFCLPLYKFLAQN